MEGSDLGHRARHRIDKFRREEDSQPHSIEGRFECTFSVDNDHAEPFSLT